MSDRISNMIQWASIVIGITGMSLDKFISVEPTIAFLLIGASFVAFVILVLIQLFHRDSNQYKGKHKVDLVWRRLLTGADRSVRVFAGDVSWAQSNKADLLSRTKSGVEVRVVCRRPSKPLLLDQVRALFAAGVQVKFYTANLVMIRGIVVDTSISLESGTALTVIKSPKHVIDIEKGITGTDSLFNYEAHRYLPKDDVNYIATLHQLFDSVWETLPIGLILTPIDLRKDKLVRILAKAPHYSHLTDDAVSIQKLHRDSLYACCRTVKAAKLEKTSAILEGYQRFKIDCYSTCKVESNSGRTLLLPPIVEQQSDGKLVVIDGMHRIFNLISMSDTQEVICIVITGLGALPSDAVPFADVQVSKVKKNRVENFLNYKHEEFRDIKSIDHHLAEIVDQ